MNKVICPYTFICKDAFGCDHSYMHKMDVDIGCYQDPRDCTYKKDDNSGKHYNKRCVILSTMSKSTKIPEKELIAKMVMDELKL